MQSLTVTVEPDEKSPSLVRLLLKYGDEAVSSVHVHRGCLAPSDILDPVLVARTLRDELRAGLAEGVHCFTGKLIRAAGAAVTDDAVQAACGFPELGLPSAVDTVKPV